MKYIIIILLFGINLLVSQSVSSNQIMSAYVDSSLSNNPQLLSLKQEIEIWQKKSVELSSIPDPVLSGAYAIEPIQTALGPQLGKIGIDQILPWFGSMGEKEAEIFAFARSKKAEYRNAELALTASVKNTWLTIFLQEKRINNLKKQMKAFNILENQAVKSLENNNNGIVEVLKIQNEKSSVQNRLENAVEKKKTLSAEFNYLLNRMPDSEISMVDNLAAIKFKIPVIDSVLFIHPLLESADYRIEAANHRSKFESLNNYPRIKLGLDYYFIGERPGMVIDDNGKDAVLVKLGVTLPLFTGKYSSAKERSMLEKRQSELNRENIRNLLINEYQIRTDRYHSSLRDLNFANEQLIRSKQALSILETSFSGTRHDFSDIFEMYREIFSKELQVDEYEVALNKAIIDFEYLSAIKAGK